LDTEPKAPNVTLPSGLPKYNPAATVLAQVKVSDVVTVPITIQQAMEKDGHLLLYSGVKNIIRRTRMRDVDDVVTMNQKHRDLALKKEKEARILDTVVPVGVGALALMANEVDFMDDTGRPVKRLQPCVVKVRAISVIVTIPCNNPLMSCAGQELQGRHGGRLQVVAARSAQRGHAGAGDRPSFLHGGDQLQFYNRSV
jgi:hypothetical protein